MTRADAGLEGPTPARFKEALDNQELIFRDTFPGMLGVKVVDVGDGYAVAELEVGPQVRHPGGYAHGGAIAGFGDTVAAWATFPSLAAGEIFTTIEFKANFITGVRDGVLRGEGRAVHKGGRTMVIDVKITCGEKLVAVMLVTQAILQPRSQDDPSLY
jgi:1,4-dihydroxy-2-naphthoyl-CoA hydrolase